MKIAKKSDAKINQVTAYCKAVEYQLMDGRIHGAVIEINGRYPDNATIFMPCAPAWYPQQHKQTS